jgi:hypothetical protein
LDEGRLDPTADSPHVVFPDSSDDSDGLDEGRLESRRQAVRLHVEPSPELFVLALFVLILLD